MRRFWFIFGAVLIVLGALSLLNVLFAALGIMFRIGWIFWPIILIGVGAWLITGFTRGDRHSDVPREQASIPLEGAAEATVTVRHGAGRLTIGSGAGPPHVPRTAWRSKMYRRIGEKMAKASGRCSRGACGASPALLPCPSRLPASDQ